MALFVEADGDQTIMDYVVSSTDIPLMGVRNKDRTLIIGEFEMHLAWACPIALREVGVIIEVAVNDATSPEFIGKIISVDFFEDKRTIKIKVQSLMIEFQEKQISSANLHADLIAGAGIEYWTDDDSNTNPFFMTPSAQILFIIQTMFDQITTGGLSFVFDTGLKDIVVGVFNDNGTPRSMEVEHLRMDENMLYSIGAGYAGNTQDKGATYFDFISEFCSHLDFKLELSSTVARQIIMKQITFNGKVSIDDDDRYSVKSDSKKGASGGYNWSHDWYDDRIQGSEGGKTNRIRYQQGGVGTLYKHTESVDEGKNSVSILTNWQYYYDLWWEGVDTCNLSSIANYPDQFFSPFDFASNKVQKQVGDFNDVIYKTPLTYQTNARMNKVEVKSQNMVVYNEVHF